MKQRTDVNNEPHLEKSVLEEKEVGNTEDYSKANQDFFNSRVEASL